MKLAPYIPEWPAYHAKLLDDAIISDGTHSWPLSRDGMVAYRLRTYVGGHELAIILPLPEGLDENPLSDRLVAESIQDVVMGMLPR